jgi:hypothetical protein
MNTISSSTPQRTLRRRRGQHMTSSERQAAQEVFLQTFSMTANVRAACMKAGIDRSMVYRWQEHDTEFGLKFRQASEDANDVIRAELFRRAIQGVEKPVVSMGKAVYVETEDGRKRPLMERVYSDNLLSLLAKARMPEFRERQRVEMSGPDGEPIQMQQQMDLSMLTDEQLAQFKQWLLDAQRRNTAR